MLLPTLRGPRNGPWRTDGWLEGAEWAGYHPTQVRVASTLTALSNPSRAWAVGVGAARTERDGHEPLGRKMPSSSRFVSRRTFMRLRIMRRGEPQIARPALESVTPGLKAPTAVLMLSAAS